MTLALGSTYQACCEACISKLNVDADKKETDSDSLPIVHTFKIASKSADDVDPNGFCGKVFEEHGTCCNQAELKARADAWSKRLKNRSEKILKGFEKMDELVGSIDKFKKWKTDNASGSTGGDIRILVDNTSGTQNQESPFTSANVWDKGKGKPKKPLSVPDETGLTKLDTELDKIKGGDKEKRQERVKNAKDQSGDCYNELMKIRKAALCLRCAGNVSDFYDSATQSYSIKEATCTTILDKCATVFSAVAEANNLFTNLAILKKVKGGNVSADAEGEKVTGDELGKWIECGDDKEACMKDKVKVAELCGQISLSSDNQKLEGNIATFSEGIQTGDAIEDGKDFSSTAEDFFKPVGRLLDSKVQSNTYRYLQNETVAPDDGYGYIKPATGFMAADLESEYSSGVTITKMLSIILMFVGVMVA